MRAQLAGSSPRQLSFSFKVDTPVVTSKIASFPNPAAAGADVMSFYTHPSAHPPVLTVTTPDHDAGAGDIFTTNGPGPGQYGPLIYDAPAAGWCGSNRSPGGRSRRTSASRPSTGSAI